MAKKQLLGLAAKQLGFYQVALLLSRLAGISRDVLILFVVGAGALTDQVFFILSFPDIFMSMLVGGGAILFLSDHYDAKDREDSIPSFVLSASLLYLFIAILFIVIESLFGSPVGRLLYVDIANNPELNAAYLVSLGALLFSLPMVAPNSIYLYEDKLFLQPLMNIVFTFAVIMLILGAYYTGKLTAHVTGVIVVAASAFRLLISICISFFTCNSMRESPSIIRDILFYKGLLLSGLSIGVLILLPFIFRAKLPEFGNGLYASSAIYFKFNDLVLAFFVIPITTIFLKRSKQHGKSLNTKLLLAALLFSVLAAATILLVINTLLRLDIDIPVLLAAPELAVFIAICLIFSTLAYVLSMMLVKLKRHRISVIAAMSSLSYLLFVQWKGRQELEQYFFDLYTCYLIYVFVILISYPLKLRKYIDVVIRYIAKGI